VGIKTDEARGAVATPQTTVSYVGGRGKALGGRFTKKVKTSTSEAAWPVNGSERNVSQGDLAPKDGRPSSGPEKAPRVYSTAVSYKSSKPGAY